MPSELEKLKTDLAKTFGEDSVMFADDMPTRPPYSTGSLTLDFATGYGGFPSDRVIEIAGNEGSGKTTLGLFTMMNFLDAQPDRAAMILDTEHKLTMNWVRDLIGSERMSRVLLLNPDHIEQATDMYRKAVGSGKICFAMLDSIGGSPTRRSTEKSAEIASFGGNSLGVGEFARSAAGYSHKYACLTVGINQIRADMDGYNRHMTPGGQAWKHACVMRIKLRKGRNKIEDKIDGELVPIGYDVIAKVIKNQVGPEGRTAWYWFYNTPTDKWGFGIDRLDEIVRLSTTTQVVEQRGAWYYHPSLPDGKVQSRATLIETVKADETLREVLVSETMERLAQYGAVVAPMTEVDDEIEAPERVRED